jgi:ribose transport system permease protein
LGFGLRDAGILLGLLAIFAVSTILSPNFLIQSNLLNILQQSSINACVALGMTLVIIVGGIDLSVSAIAAITAVAAAALMAAGAVNGALVAYDGLQPFIVTLGTLSLYRASALIYTGGNPIFGIPPGFRTLFNASVFGIPSPVLIVVILALIVWVVLNKTPLGSISRPLAATRRRPTSLACRWH